jgi:hypothetical protein
MATSRSGPDKVESVVAWFVIGILGLVALWAVTKSFTLNPAVKLAGLKAAGQAGGGAAADLPPYLPASQLTADRIERFGPDNLHLKIDGKAELYLASGFKALTARRFRLAGPGGDWFEVFRYEMVSVASAFAAYSQQRRPRAEFLPLTPYAYWMANGLFLVHGRYYVEVIGSRTDAALKRAILAWGRRFVAATKVRTPRVAELSWFPTADLDPRGFLYWVKSALGFRRLDRVFAAVYGRGNRALTAFVSRRASAAEAADLAREMIQTLVKSGGRLLAAPKDLPTAQVVVIAGLHLVVFHQGRFLAGVHQAEDLPAALALARRLQRHLSSRGS